MCQDKDRYGRNCGLGESLFTVLLDVDSSSSSMSSIFVSDRLSWAEKTTNQMFDLLRPKVSVKPGSGRYCSSSSQAPTPTPAALPLPLQLLEMLGWAMQLFRLGYVTIWLCVVWYSDAALRKVDGENYNPGSSWAEERNNYLQFSSDKTDSSPAGKK